MTGTAREVAAELRAVYRLESVTIPTHRRCIRRYQPAVFCTDEDHKWRRLIAEVRALTEAGRPVLIGTRSVESSEALSRELTAAGLEHRVLNARQDADEADLVADAGQPGTITVATNMAGRGTDIRLGPGVAEAGGLAVLLTEWHDARRIDRQLFGRCARQGDPGSCRAVVALSDSLFAEHAPLAQRALARLHRGRESLPSPWLALLRRRAQRRAERIHARTRRDTLRQDRQLDVTLGFAGNQI
jgi:preprotein translocase subunit SecA